MPISWENSGDQSLHLTLEDVQRLAVDSGFVFENSSPDMPLVKRANLSALFDLYKVNSVSSFAKLFAASKLLPSWEVSQGHTRKQLSTGHKMSVHQTSSSTFVGELESGVPHGMGLMLKKGDTSHLYIGCFQSGKRHGFGEVLTSRGESFQGSFLDDLMWGPGRYEYPRPPADKTVPCNRVVHSYEGMFNGRPLGAGVITYGDGKKVAGFYDGRECQEELTLAECEDVLQAAEINAKQARQQSYHIKQQLQDCDLWVQTLPLLATVCQEFLQ